MKKIDTAASRGFRIASRLIGYIGLGLSLVLFILGYAMPKGFWFMDKGFCIDFLGDWGRLDLAENKQKLMILCIVAGSVLVIAILFRIISACCKKTVEEAVEEEYQKAVEEGIAVADAEEKKTSKIRQAVEKVVPEDKRHYLDEADKFVKDHSTIIITAAVTASVIAVLAGIRKSRRKNYRY